MGRKRQFDRTAAVEVAKELFWQQGYEGLSIRDLGTELNLRPGSLYQAFGSKEALFEEVLEIYGQKNRDLLADSLAMGGKPLEGYRHFLSQVALEERQCRTCLVARTAAAITTPLRLRQKAQAMMAEFESQLAHWLDRLKADGRLVSETNCRQFARLMQSQIIGIRALADSGLSRHHIEETIALQIQGIEPIFV